jgi:hypothetical protein
MVARWWARKGPCPPYKKFIILRNPVFSQNGVSKYPIIYPQAVIINN